MELIPAIDLRVGRCVRLYQGKRDQETVFSDDPLAVARDWVRDGARRLHLVDLDGAFEGAPRNYEIVARIAKDLAIPVQLGGGIRTYEDAVAALNTGVAKIILGTVAISNPALVQRLSDSFPGKIIVAVDARDGLVAIKGWVESSLRKAVCLAQEMQNFGVEEIIYTDIKRDGTLKGPNIKVLTDLVRSLSASVIASGGVSSLEDLCCLRRLKPAVAGVIVGQALYTGKFSLAEAVDVCCGASQMRE